MKNLAKNRIKNRRLIILLSFLFVSLSIQLSAIAEEAKININTSPVKTLQQLNGIGKKLAQKIVKYREEKGPFATISDIKKVKGIGKQTFEKIKDHITVGTEVSK